MNASCGILMSQPLIIHEKIVDTIGQRDFFDRGKIAWKAIKFTNTKV